MQSASKIRPGIPKKYIRRQWPPCTEVLDINSCAELAENKAWHEDEKDQLTQSLPSRWLENFLQNREHKR